MIVLDASAVVELLLGTERGRRVSAQIADPSVGLHVPHLVDVAVTQALMRDALDRELAGSSARMALEDFRALDLTRHAREPLLGRVWELRRNLSAYDAVYVALAEALDSRLVTCDARLARAPGVTARVDVL